MESHLKAISPGVQLGAAAVPHVVKPVEVEQIHELLHIAKRILPSPDTTLFIFTTSSFFRLTLQKWIPLTELPIASSGGEYSATHITFGTT